MASIKLVAVDLDDTLLRNDLTISPRAKMVINELSQRGVKVIICTGRMYCSAKAFAIELENDLPMVTCNGALIKTSFNGKVLSSKVVPSSFCYRYKRK